MLSATSRDDVILDLYRASLDPGAWEHAISALGGLVGGAGGLIGIWNKLTGLLQFFGTAGLIAPRSQALFRNRFGSDDPLRSMLDCNPAGVWSASSLDTDFIASGESFSACWLAARGVRHFIGARVWDTTEHYALVWLCRASDVTPFGRKEISVLEPFTPHVSCAVALTARLRVATLRSQGLQVASRRYRPAYLITDAAGRILESNDTARTLLRQADGLLAEAEQLAASRHFETAKLRQDIQTVSYAHASGLTGANRLMLVGRPSERLPYIVSISHFDGMGLFSTRPDMPLALVCIADLAEFTNVPSDDLCELFSLTPAEGRLAAALAQGKRLQEIAVEFGVKMPTLRTQIASILRKLDVKNQSDIVRIALSIPSISGGA